MTAPWCRASSQVQHRSDEVMTFRRDANRLTALTATARAAADRSWWRPHACAPSRHHDSDETKYERPSTALESTSGNDRQGWHHAHRRTSSSSSCQPASTRLPAAGVLVFSHPTLGAASNARCAARTKPRASPPTVTCNSGPDRSENHVEARAATPLPRPLRSLLWPRLQLTSAHRCALGIGVTMRSSALRPKAAG